jgi:eukaryotic-like serine/threonine-protein kinase
MDDDIARYSRLLGQTLCGKWRVDALLGVGGAACVYSATHRNGKRVAIKALHRELSADEDFVSRFVQEGYVANEVGHPGVVSALDDDRTEDGLVFLVMDLLQGKVLSDHIAATKAGLEPFVALTIVDEVLDVLAAAHAKKIVHRDVKPDNIFVVSHDKGNVSIKLLDFGIARFRDNPNRQNQTEMGARMGTPAYMPPEQARGHNDKIDARADIFAVGATLLELLTKRTLHEAETVNEKLLLAMTRPAPKTQDMIPGAAPALCEVLDRSLAFDREARYPSAKEMQTAVREALTATPIAPGRYKRGEGTLIFAEGAFPSLPAAKPLLIHATPGGSPIFGASPPTTVVTPMPSQAPARPQATPTAADPQVHYTSTPDPSFVPRTTPAHLPTHSIVTIEKKHLALLIGVGVLFVGILGVGLIIFLAAKGPTQVTEPSMTADTTTATARSATSTATPANSTYSASFETAPTVSEPAVTASSVAKMATTLTPKPPPPKITSGPKPSAVLDPLAGPRKGAH